MTDDRSRSPRSATLGLTVLRGLAVLFAVSVMGCYVWDAQRRADERAAEQARQSESAVPAGAAADGTVANGTVANGTGLQGNAVSGNGTAELELPLGSPHTPPEFLSSSKFAVIVDQNDQPLPSSKGMVLPTDVFLMGSKSGVSPPAVLPSSKVLVIDESQFLFSSKSAAPLPVPSPPAGVEPPAPERKQDESGTERKPER